ncbi:MAG: GyrI-like domain-containing protein [Flavobacteriales bacterium]
MIPKLVHLKTKTLIGMHTKMSLAENKTGMLWSQFSPRIHEIQGRISEDKFSLQVYPPSYFQEFNPHSTFEKWAAVESADFKSVPTNMNAFTLHGGFYAVFHYVGNSSDSSIFNWIFSEWLPDSGHSLDDRPHFEVLGSKYKNNDPLSEEEIWIPIAY